MLTWISQNFVLITYANQKLWRKNLWGGGRLDPLVTEGLRLLKFHLLCFVSMTFSFYVSSGEINMDKKMEKTSTKGGS